MRAADYIVDIGPGAGEHGGQVVAAGTAEEIMKNARFHHRRIPERPDEDSGAGARDGQPTGWLTVKGAQENNLKNIDVDIPAGSADLCDRRVRFGKSSLVNEILYKTLAKKLNRARTIPGKHEGYRGHGAAGQGHCHRPVPHRTDAPFQSGYLYRRV